MKTTISTDISQSVDANSRQSQFATIYLGIIGPAIFFVQPRFIQGLAGYSLTGLEVKTVADNR